MREKYPLFLPAKYGPLQSNVYKEAREVKTNQAKHTSIESKSSLARTLQYC